MVYVVRAFLVVWDESSSKGSKKEIIIMKRRERERVASLLTINVSGKNSCKEKLSFRSFRLFLVLADFSRLARCSLSLEE